MPFQQKDLRVLPVTKVAGRQVKRYVVTTPGLDIAPELQQAAEAYLPTLFPSFEDTETAPITFTVLHRGAAGMYLNAYSWVWTNVIHCRTAATGDQPFLGSTDPDLLEWAEIQMPLVGCVWELPPLEYERAAWVRHVLSPDVPDHAAYLADTFPAGKVG
ncbi:MAG: hypothetical protein ACR2KJ_07670 [Jatrophihabitans sp.]